MSDTNKKNVESQENSESGSEGVIPLYTYKRSVTFDNIKSFIGDSEPYCDKHVEETKRIGDEIVRDGENTINKPCVLCSIGV